MKKTNVFNLTAILILLACIGLSVYMATQSVGFHLVIWIISGAAMVILLGINIGIATHKND